MPPSSFMLSEVFIVERIIASGHADLEDLTCEARVCTSEQQAYCEAISSMIEFSQDEHYEVDEEENLRAELTKAMKRKGVNLEKRYRTIKDLIIGASRLFNAEKTYYSVRKSEILAHEEVDEKVMIQQALACLGAASGAGMPSGSSANKIKPPVRDPALRGRGRVLPPLAVNQERNQEMTRKRPRSEGEEYVSLSDDDDLY